VCTFIFNVIFAAEAFSKMIGFGFSAYIASRWNQFDLFLVSASLMDVLMDVGLVPDGGPIISVIRVFRIFRVMRMFRLAKHFSGLRKMASVLLVSLPSIINVGSLLMLFYFIFGVLGCSFFKDVPQDGEGITRHTNFKNLGFAMLTLFRISTGEDWHTIMHDCMQVTHAAPLFFVVFILCIMFVLINVFVACVVDNMKVTSGETINYDQFATTWTKYDTEVTWWMSGDQLVDFLGDLSRPLGFPNEVDETAKIQFISDANIPSHDGKHHFSEVLYCLARRLGGVSLPESSLSNEIETQMRKTFPVYKKDPSTIVTAIQRLSVYKFINKLRQRIIIKKLKKHRATGEPFAADLGLTSEECRAGAIIMSCTLQMVVAQDPVESQPLAQIRAALLDPKRAEEYLKLMQERRQRSQKRLAEAGGDWALVYAKGQRRPSTEDSTAITNVTNETNEAAAETELEAID